MSEKDSPVNRVDVVGDVVVEHMRVDHHDKSDQSDPPNGGPVGLSMCTPSDADGANSLPTPESPILDFVPPKNPKARTTTARVNGLQAKVAIPRDTNKYFQTFTPGRVSRACSSCRSRKVKCSGEQPACRQCRELDLRCRYPMSWREEMKREVDSHLAVVKDYQDFVRELVCTADPPTRQWINATMQKYQLLQDDSIEPDELLYKPTGNNNSTNLGGIEEYLMNTDQMPISPPQQYTMFETKGLGQTDILKFSGVEAQPKSKEVFARAFEIDFMNIIDNDLSASPVQKYGLPARSAADTLFHDYLNNIHSEFPIINKQLFRTQYMNLWECSQQPGDKWLAILNMMFAIAALHIHCLHPQWNDRNYDHSMYFTRAKLLSMTEADLLGHPDLQQIQIEALCAFYLLATEEFDKAWRVAALAARAAVALSTNLKTTKNHNPFSREARFRLWWCVYTFEQVIGLISCRPTSISYNQHSIPYPVRLQEDEQRTKTQQSTFTHESQLEFERIFAGEDYTDFSPSDENSLETTADAFFVFSCKLAVIIQDISSILYKLRTSPEKERITNDLLCRLNAWRDTLPLHLDLNNGAPSLNGNYKARLAFHFHGARIAIARPWLFCRNMIEYNHTSYNMSHVALDSAKTLLAMVPGELDMANSHQILPWWCALHYTTEATKIVFMELSLGCVHTQNEQAYLIRLVQKSIRYFEVMSFRSSRARKAWEHFGSLYGRLCVRMGYSADNMPHITENVNHFDFYINHSGSEFDDIGRIDSFDFYADIGGSV
ncbi:hypothetical protein N7478_011945 [Penicillium angulare]|uniref:uncharacterized protein n=1 Tax=Penicillium angulare TaxID=116970 RepID=UPI002541356C|nr:uncharacterized protein N7478_011945 [Penicillium angulare]KAJ5261350.1 hypothetical protein N7478_011945 [Penicillium angulare]